MKKIYLSVIATLVAVSGILVSCTADDEFEMEQNAREAKAQEMKTQILALAEEYGLDVEVGDLTRGQLIDDKEALEKIESSFKSICSIKGRYKLTAKRNGNAVTVTQDKIQRRRTRSISPTYETFDYEFGGYESGGFGFYCILYYTEELETGKWINAWVDAGVNKTPASIITGSVGNDVYVGIDLKKHIITISGSVKVYQVFSNTDVIIKVHVDGYFDGSNGEIEWS